jgi:peptidoglycan/xylan/chitin deacetylase (PgdA/CDA1 family)
VPAPTRRSFLLGAAACLAAAACASGDPGAAGSNGAPDTGTAPPPPGSPPPAPPDTARPAAVDAGAPPSTRPTGARFAARGPADDTRVALTFHTDGSLDVAARLVDALARASVPATCFIVGSWLEANPTWARRLLDAGHELANHTYSHPTAGRLTADALQHDIERCRDVLVRLTGSPGRLFRPSGTDDGLAEPGPAIMAAATAAGYPVVAGFDVDPLDYRDPGAAAVRTRTLAAVRGGSVVSLHFGHPGTVDALPAILSGLRDRGLRPVTAGELLSGV